MRKIVTASLLLAVAVPLLAQRQRAITRTVVAEPANITAREPLDGPWTIEIKTTGGITGGGNGDIRISSDGTIVVGQFVPTGKSCQYLAPVGELFDLAARIKQARADLWFADYTPADLSQRCCDLIFTQVKLTRTEYDPNMKRNVTSIYETEVGGARPIPSDLLAILNRAAWDADSLKRRYDPLCR